MTLEKFLAYVRIQIEGRTNMLDANAVVALSGGVLTREDCYDIRQNYEEYRARWPLDREGAEVPMVIEWNDLTQVAQKRLLLESKRTGESIEEVVNRLVKEHLS